MPMKRRRSLIRMKNNNLKKLLDWIHESHDVLTEDMTIRDVKEDSVEVIPVTEESHAQDILAVRERVFDDSNRKVKLLHRLYVVLAILFALFFSTVLVITVSNMPPFGDINNPVNNEVAERYINDGLEETGATNIVAGMILDYRAFDTLGESHVLFVAAITVTILLRLDKTKRDPKDTKITETSVEAEEEDRIFETKHDTILKKVAIMLVPIIFMFGIYVILNGHLSPGGGFSGGAIIGAGLILFLNAFGFEKTEKFFTEKVYKRVSVAALMFYALAKCYAFFCGANGLDSHISKGIAGHIISAGLILPLDIAVGCVVACTMYAFYAMFRKGGF